MEPLVSVIIPCYNCADSITKTVDTVFSQTYKNIELLLIDDCSTDEKTFLIIQEIKKNNSHKVKVFSTPYNGGQSLARNIGINNSCGKYVAFLDSDDLWLPNKIFDQVSFMENHNDYFFVGANQFFMYGKNSNKEKSGFVSKTLKQLLFRNCFGMSSILMRNDSFYRFDESVRYSADFHFLCSILSDGNKSALLNKRMLVYDNGGTNRISSKHKKDQHKSCKLLLKKLFNQKKISLFSFVFFVFLYDIKYLRNVLFR